MSKKRQRVWFWVWLALFFLLPVGRNEALADQARGYILPGSDTIMYSPEDISGMSAQVACYARNEIYARCGRMFLSPELSGYFMQQYWYSPICAPDQFSDDMLNVYEAANVALLKMQEEQMGGYALDQAGYSYQPVYDYIDLSGQRSDTGSYDVDPDSYIIYGSDVSPLTPQEIQSLSLQELCYARNEIYARHGRMFASSELADYFGQKNWYWGNIPPDSFDENMLSQTEKDNIWLLKARETAMNPGGYVLDLGGYTYSQIGSYVASGRISAMDGGAGEYLFRDSSQRYLTDEEVSQLGLRELCYARNEIYARRGYIFSSQELRDYFSAKSWYHGTITAASFSSSIFNEYELYNIELLKQYEYGINPSGYQLY